MNDDLISRQEALVSIKNLYPDMPVVDIMNARQKWLEKYAPYFECENAIEQLQPINPQEPKTGHWIDHQEGRWIYAKCSECGTIHDTQTNYCPNCGARMTESEDAE